MLRKRIPGIGVIVAVLVVLAAVPAYAGPDKASIEADGLNPHGVIGQEVTFTTVTADRVEYPWINARCYQDGELVYAQWHGAFDRYSFDPVFTLGPTPSWQSGDAECVAEVGVRNKNGKFRALARYEFTVADLADVSESTAASADEGSALQTGVSAGDAAGSSADGGDTAAVVPASFGGSSVYPI